MYCVQSGTVQLEISGALDAKLTETKVDASNALANNLIIEKG